MNSTLQRKLLIRTVGFRRNADPVTISIEYHLPVFPRCDYSMYSRSAQVRNFNETRSPLVRHRLRQSVVKAQRRARMMLAHPWE